MIEADLTRVSLRREVSLAAGVPCEFLEGIDVLPVVPFGVLPRELDARPLVDEVGVPEATLKHGAAVTVHVITGADTGGDKHGPARVADGRLGDDVHHPAGRVRPVEGSARPQGHLDPVDIQIGGGDHVVGVEPEGGNVGVAVVRHGQEGA